MAASAYDTMAPRFERQRALPDGVAQSVRSLVLAAAKHTNAPRILDLGAGSGRFGWPFVAAGDDYVGVDLSSGMLGVFAKKDFGERQAVLLQADGQTLPFADASFDAVVLIAMFGDLPDWRPLVTEACRVLRPHGAIIIGRIAMPNDGIDESLKQRLDILLDARTRKGPQKKHGRKHAAQYLAAMASTTTDLVAASWQVERSPRNFLDRHAGGARFSRLPQSVREDAMRALADWAAEQFGSLDAAFTETHRFEVQIFRFGEE